MAAMAMLLVGVLGAIVLRAAPSDPESNSLEPPDAARGSGCMLTVKSVQIPAQEAGVLVELAAREGDEVKVDQVVARIDASQANAVKAVADAKLKAAAQEAASDVNIRYATTGRMVAEAELQAAEQANKQAEGAFSWWDVRRLRYKVIEAALHIDQATNDYKIAQYKLEVQTAEVAAATLDVQRRQVKCPANGKVEKRLREPGEWVRPGDTVYQIMLMDRLIVQQDVDAARFSPADVHGKKVLVTVMLDNGRKVTVEGTVLSVSNQEVAGQRFQVKAEVPNKRENGHWVLRHGQIGQMKILTDRPADKAGSGPATSSGNP